MCVLRAVGTIIDGDDDDDDDDLISSLSSTITRAPVVLHFMLYIIDKSINTYYFLQEK